MARRYILQCQASLVANSVQRKSRRSRPLHKGDAFDPKPKSRQWLFLAPITGKKICRCQPLHFAGFLRYWKQNQVSVRKPTHAPSTRPLSAIGPPQVNRPTGARALPFRVGVYCPARTKSHQTRRVDAMTSFAHDLSRLIRMHLGKPRWGDDFQPIADALDAATHRVEERADRYRYRDESEADFKRRVRRKARAA
jgi:hypothetical protein